MSVDDQHWRFYQSFGDDNASDDDLVTAVEFDETGDYLAVADKGGRICIFEGSVDERKDESGRRGPMVYKFYTEFQSHEMEFDPLKSEKIEERISMVRWTKRQSAGLFLLATNDKTIKYWKVHEKKQKRAVRVPSMTRAPSNQDALSIVSSPSSALVSNNGPINAVSEITIPKMVHAQTITTATAKRTYANAHNYHIHSISVCSDGVTFISSDELRINLWNLEISNESFNIVDIKPPSIDELTEVITSATFHPTDCSLLLHSSSRGAMKLLDLRQHALGDTPAKLFEVEDDAVVNNKTVVSEMIRSISDAKFTPDGQKIISRDYLTLKVWDVRMENRTLSVIPVHSYLEPYLWDLYENECILDMFKCASSSDGQRFVTGSYNNNFLVHNLATGNSITIEAPNDAPKPKKSKTEGKNGDKKDSSKDKKKQADKVPDVSLMDFGKKALHCAWHPSAPCVAVAGLNVLYMYQAGPT